ncbi:complement regulatory protein [Trypanosoma cruzi]|nr:complement regulatory protein [Trypanosoma cruzi]
MHAQDAHCSGFGCFFCSVCWRLRVAAASSVGMKRGEERGSAPRVTLPAGVMRAVGRDCCGGPHPFGVRFSAVVPCGCSCHLLCACVLGMCFRSVGRPPSFFCGLCERARADEDQGAWNEGMA